MQSLNPEDLLPGVEGPTPPRVTAGDLGRDVYTARRHAALEELLDLAVLIVVNLVFLLWNRSQLPFLGRDVTLVILVAANAFAVAGYLRARVVPRVRARRVAATWSAQERDRFRQAA